MIRNQDVYKRCGVAPLKMYISRNRLRWLGHLFRLPDDRLAKQVLFGTLDDSNGRGKGAPRLSWIDCIYKDIEAAGISSLGTKFRKKVLDKSKWRELIRGPIENFEAD